ncbi:MAG TPA: hypothetical protein VFE33_14755 [Thermoanaerobaculia bacterium]|nr:hypothetical protein [Thermoanaerobaculia bacterium]
MRKRNLALLGLALLFVATAGWAADATSTAVPVWASPADASAVAPLASDPLSSPQPVLTFQCPPEPITSCNSCLYFGIPSSYSCTIFCVNGVPHRSCNTCGEGCNL